MQCIVTIGLWVGSSALLLNIQSVVYGPRYLVVLQGSPLVSEGVVMTYICVSGEGRDFWSSVPGQWSWGGGNLSEFTGIHTKLATRWDCPRDPESAGFNCPRGLISGQCLGYL